MWRQVGIAVVGPRDSEVVLGRVSASLSASYLPLRFSSSTGGGLLPLAFGVVLPVSVAANGGLPSGRYYPHPDPSIVTLGPGIGTAFDGVLRFRPRNYNLRWISVGYPGRYWAVAVEAWAPVGVTVPQFRPYGFTDGDLEFRLSPDLSGPSGATPLIRD